MSKTIETKIAQIGTFPVGKFSSPITPAFNATTFLAGELSALSPISSESLTDVGSTVYDGLYYGGVDTPTTKQLASQLADLEGADHCILTASGQAAIHLLLVTILRSGDHILVCDNVTYSSKWLFEFYSSACNIQLEYFSPAETYSLHHKLKDTTKIVFWESPGAFTFELVDGQHIAQLCKEKDIVTVHDNTWSSSVFHHPLQHGITVSLISLTKTHAAVAGRSLGALLTNGSALYQEAKSVSALLGGHVSSDACSDTLISISTLGARLERQMKSATVVIDALRENKFVKQVFHPTISSADETLYLRDYKGFNSLISVETVLDEEQLRQRLSRLKVVRAGYGWGGTVSLVNIFDPSAWPTGERHNISNGCIRFFIGLEASSDIVSDIVQALNP